MFGINIAVYLIWRCVMKNKKNQKSSLVIFRALIAFSTVIVFGCSLGDEDFSDIQTIEKIIRNDQEQVFGVELANDEDALSGDSLDAAARTVSLGSMKVRTDIFAGLEQGLFFGRVVVKSARKIVVSKINDSLASAEVSYTLSGYLKIIRSQWSRSKPFEHQIKRYMTFIKTRNPETGEPWHRVSVTAAYGVSENAGMVIDSVRIMTAHDSVIAESPFGLIMLQNRPLTLHRGDLIWIDIKARTLLNPADSLAGLVISGQNKYRKDYRERKPMFYSHSDRYVRLIGIGAGQRLGYNQLMIDFYDRNTLRKIEEPYRSMVLSIPYKVIP